MLGSPVRVPAGLHGGHRADADLAAPVAAAAALAERDADRAAALRVHPGDVDQLGPAGLLPRALLLAIIFWSFFSHLGWTFPPWLVVLLLVIYTERVVTVRKAGPRGVLLTVLLAPEWGYALFDGLFLFQALRREFTQRDISWGHVERESTGDAARHDYGRYPRGRPVPVPETGHGRHGRRGGGPADSDPAQAGARIPMPRAGGDLATGQRPPSRPPRPGDFPDAAPAGRWPQPPLPRPLRPGFQGNQDPGLQARSGWQ